MEEKFVPFDCPACGTWVCKKCGYKRKAANRFFADHYCTKCGSKEGVMKPVQHQREAGALEEKRDAETDIKNGMTWYWPLEETKMKERCKYEKRWVEEVGEIWVCSIHNENSRFDIDCGYAPCLAIDPYPPVGPSPEDFLDARLKEVEAEWTHIFIMRQMLATQREIVRQFKEWPVLLQAPVEIEVESHDIQGLTYKAIQKIQWLSTQEYVKRFGTHPPTTPMIRSMLRMWSKHPDFKQEWLE